MPRAKQTPAKGNSNLMLAGILAVLAYLHLTGGVVTPPGPAPIPTAGFRVLLIEETEDRGKLPLGQLNQLTATGPGSVIAFCRAKCIATPTDPGWKRLDKDADVSGLGEPWATAWKNKGPTVPWLMASNGKTGFSGPLPPTPEETIKILEKFAK